MELIKAFIITLLIAVAQGLTAPPSACASSITDSQVERSLKRLDNELLHRRVYINRRVARLDSLKKERQALADTLWQLRTTMEIARGYSAFNNDSALIYYTKGYDEAMAATRELCDSRQRHSADSMAREFRMWRATYLALGGMVSDALKEYEQVDTTGMPSGFMASYYDAGRQMYSYITALYSDWVESYDYWQNRTMESQHKLLPKLQPDDDRYLLNLGEYYFRLREYAHSREVLLQLISHIDEDSPYYAIAANILAQIAITRGDHNEFVYYLSRSAISDTRQATLEVTSLQELAGVLFEAGDRDRAHNYVTVALENAVASHASVRMMKTSQLLSIVEEDHNAQAQSWRTWMYATIFVLVMCMMALIVSLFLLRRQLHHVATMRQEIEGANRTKDVYISQFMELCSAYMDKLRQLGKVVNRKLSAGQADELLKLTKSGKFVDDQSADFYKMFDEAFLHIYPDFVGRVNSLLRPDERIVPEDSSRLNSDLRILAFMRLGIDDTQRVAQILNFSVNTIYAYRNRLRNRAIRRDTFEQDIMAIDFYSPKG